MTLSILYCRANTVRPNMFVIFPEAALGFLKMDFLLPGYNKNHTMCKIHLNDVCIHNKIYKSPK